MDQPSRKFSWTVWGGLWLTIALIGLAFVLSRRTSGPATVTLPVYSQVSAFTLTNQLGAPVTLDDLRGQVWVTDIIFTRCPGPCAKMTRQMAELQSDLPDDKRVKLVSLTTDPDFDLPDVLGRYGQRFGADDNRWWFLTGTKSQIAKLAIEGLKLTAIEKQPEERDSENDLFIHSTIFVVVDQQGRLRGVFESQPSQYDENGELLPGVDPEKQWDDVRGRIVDTVKQLLREDPT